MSMQSPLVSDDHSQYELSKPISPSKNSLDTERRHLKRKLLPSNQQRAGMMDLIKSGLRFAGGCGASRGSSLVLLLLALVSSIDLHVRCQDFEDLKNNNLQRQAPNFQAQQFANQPAQQQAIQPSRQQQFLGVGAASVQTDQGAASVNSRASFQRPVLSTRFSQQQQQQQPASHSSVSANSVVFGSQQSAAPQAASNIEAVMKTALARTAKLEAAEPRQDLGISQALPELASQSRSSSQSAQPSQTSSTAQREREAEASESTASTQPAEEAAEKQTTTQASHETVYSDQRFANLFARRSAAKKSKLVPMEQPKAKPTLPSFIKSLPDPKQFTANPLEQPDRPSGSSSSNLVSARLQQQQQQANQNRTAKKSATVTSSPALASNKRGQAQKAASSAPKAGASAKPAAGATKPSATANNPFSKSQANSSDQANVIAMARRRLLANNAAQQKQLAN